MSSQLSVFLFFAFCASVIGLLRFLAERSIRYRDVVRAQYVNASLILIWRNAVVLAPLTGSASLILAIAALTSRLITAWLFLPALALADLYVLAAYRVPSPLLPGWLRSEIRTGITSAANPSRSDWIAFWLVMPLLMLGTIGIPVLILVYHEAG